MTFLEVGGPGLTVKRKSKTPGKIHWEGHKTVAANASEKLPELASVFFATGRKLGPASSFKELHRFRLLTKRFRYTLELFSPCYGPGLKRRIKALQDLQTYLGDVNDCATTHGLLLDRDDLPAAERHRLKRKLNVLATGRIANFQRHWQEAFAEPHGEQWWSDYLVRFAGRSGR